MREGLARSLNSVAVQVSERAGRRRVVETAHRVGIVSELRPIPSLALGSNEVGIMELVSVYAAFANGGRGVLPHGIRDIRTVGGKSLYKRQGGGPGIVVAARPLVQLQEMMQAVIDEGSGQRADIGRPAAGKTGTTQDSRDAWFIGYTAQIVAGVWLGNDDGMAMTDVSGGGFAARIWRDFMLAAHADLPVLPLNRPQAGPEVASSGNGAVTIEVDVNRFVDRIWKVLGGGEPARQDRKGSDYPNLNVN
jgi:penicillin-binding protein 1A